MTGESVISLGRPYATPQATVIASEAKIPASGPIPMYQVQPRRSRVSPNLGIAERLDCFASLAMTAARLFV